MKKLKKILSITICLVFTFVLFTTTVSAEENKQTTQSTITSEKTAYIDSILKEYLLLEKHTPSDDYYISNSYQINYFNSNTVDNATEIYFVFKDNDVIGMLTVGYNNDEYISKYSKLSNDVITDLYADKTPFALGYEDDDLYAYYNNQLIALLNDATTDIDLSAKSITAQVIVKERSYVFVQSRSTTPTTNILSVSHVANASTSSGKGLCWAANIAMKVNFHRNYVVTLSALDIYNILNNRYSGTPIGTPLWIKRGYDLFNINYTYTDSGLTSSQVVSAINNNKPIDIGVKNDTSAHGVLIVGYSVYINRAIYVINDPNIHSGNVYQDVSYAAMNYPHLFTYIGNDTYDDWYESYY